MNTVSRTRIAPEWAWFLLLAILLLTTWWRAHTFAPALRERMGLELWPAIRGESEPLDCDESAYAYMGRRMNEGAVLYRDLVENKPPGGYWIYALATRLGNANEWTIRVMPIPIVLATVFLIWWVGIELAGPGAACLAALLYGLMSTDPYLYGNGAQFELLLNLFGVAALAALVRPQSRRGDLWPLLAGAAIAAATLIRQTAIVLLPVAIFVLWLAPTPADPSVPESSRARRSGARGAAFVFLGFGVVIAAAAIILIVQGAGAAAFENIIVAGRALVTDTPEPARAPPFWARWLTGNSDPRTGALPWPFGRTDWLVWWGTGSWPLWLTGAGGLLWCGFIRPTTGRRTLVVWTLAAFAQVVAPRQYWAHYYLLPTPGLALLTAIMLADLLCLFYASARGRRARAGLTAAALALLVIAAIGSTIVIQIRDYLLVPSGQLTARYKGGRQWIRLREIGRDLANRTREWPDASLFVWGWQSPLYVYSGLDSPSRHFFVNDLVKAYADRPHPLVQKWVGQIMTELEADPPTVVFTGDPPFPALRQFLARHYTRSSAVPDAPVLWVLSSHFQTFEEALRPRAIIPSAPLPYGGGIWAWLPESVAVRPQAIPAPATGVGESRRVVPFDRDRRR